MDQLKDPEAGLLNKSSRLNCSFRRDQIYSNHCYVFWSHFVVLLKSDINVQQTHLRARCQARTN